MDQGFEFRAYHPQFVEALAKLSALGVQVPVKAHEHADTDGVDERQVAAVEDHVVGGYDREDSEPGFERVSGR